MILFCSQFRIRINTTAFRSQIGIFYFIFFQAEDGIRDLVRSRGLGDVYKRQDINKGEEE